MQSVIASAKLQTFHCDVKGFGLHFVCIVTTDILQTICKARVNARE